MSNVVLSRFLKQSHVTPSPREEKARWRSRRPPKAGFKAASASCSKGLRNAVTERGEEGRGVSAPRGPCGTRVCDGGAVLHVSGPSQRTRWLRHLTSRLHVPTRPCVPRTSLSLIFEAAFTALKFPSVSSPRCNMSKSLYVTCLFNSDPQE